MLNKQNTPISFRLPDWATNQLEQMEEEQKRSKNLIARNLFLTQLSKEDDLRQFLKDEADEAVKRQEEQQASIARLARSVAQLQEFTIGLIDHIVKQSTDPDLTIKSVLLEGRRIVEAATKTNK